MRTISLGIVSLMFMLILSGCWNRTELNELGIVVATGLDYMDGEWIISYQVIVPSNMASGNGGQSGSASQPAVHVFSVNSKSIHQALNLSNLEHPRRVYVAHNKVVVIGRNAAERGIGELMDYYFRNTEPRETVKMALTEGQAIEVLNKLSPPEKLPGASLSDMLSKESDQVSAYPIISVFNFALKMNSDSKGVGVPVIDLAGERTPGREEELKSEDVLKQTQQPLKMKITKLAIFNHDRLVGFLDYKESYGLSWITGEVHQTEISFPCSKEARTQEHAGFTVSSSKTQITPRKSGSHFAMQVKVKVKGNLTESTCQQDLTNPKVIKELEAQIDQQIEDYIMTGWSAMKKLKTDAAGLADKIHRKYPSDWRRIKENWQDELAQMDLDVQVQTTIKRTGLILKSFEQSEQE
ncbi:Ger(x)C family spore germination protein [Paenibacillus zeisoli]|uniref:Ger(X)C family spore germination protein n=1 Tax=Paenibacillus zeisoli TaxID=2496267 RepID=A0A3S1E1A6_9BACL|nr:Ger(x)C family spore germination protein [Paenibacillus zeisoli]RUT35674.1 Ger(x)C family spore germination protein [Paenibacillus zeisoli]